MTIFQVKIDDDKTAIHFASLADLGQFLQAGMEAEAPVPGEVVSLQIVARQMSRQTFDALPVWEGKERR